MEQVKKKYKNLDKVVKAIRIIGWANVIIGTLVAFPAFGWPGLYTFIGFIVLSGVVVSTVLLFAISESIQVILDIQENTSKTVQALFSLGQLMNQPDQIEAKQKKGID